MNIEMNIGQHGIYFLYDLPVWSGVLSVEIRDVLRTQSNSFQSFTIIAKSFILDVWQGSMFWMRLFKTHMLYVSIRIKNWHRKYFLGTLIRGYDCSLINENKSIKVLPKFFKSTELWNLKLPWLILYFMQPDRFWNFDPLTRSVHWKVIHARSFQMQVCLSMYHLLVDSRH